MKLTIAHRLMKRIAAGAIIFYIFSGVSSLLNYVFYPVIARFINVGAYGEVQFLVSMFTQLAVGFVVLNILAIIIGAELKDREEQKKATSSLNIVAGTITTFIVIVGVSVLLTQRNSLGLTSTFSIIALGLSLLINVPFTIAIGKLQGNGMFVASGVISMLGAFLKLVFSLLFVIMGWGVAGAIAGIFVGMLVSLCVIEIFNYLKNKQINYPTVKHFAQNHLSQLAFIRNRAIVALISITIITLLSAADSITSRIILSSTEAGRYAAVATIAKMILAAASPLMWLALPPAVENDKKSILKYVIITFGLASIATVVFSIFPAFFTTTIIGVDAKSYTQLLPLAAMSMTLCATAFIVLTSSICIGYLRAVLTVSAIAVAGFFTTLVIVIPMAGSLLATLYAQSVASLCFVAILSVRLLRKQ